MAARVLPRTRALNNVVSARNPAWSLWKLEGPRSKKVLAIVPFKAGSERTVEALAKLTGKTRMNMSSFDTRPDM